MSTMKVEHALHAGRAWRRLVMVQARSLLHGLGVRAGSGKGRAVASAAVVVLLAAMAVGYLHMLGEGMAAVGEAEAIPALAMFVGALVSVTFVFLKAPGTVFGCKDYDLVAALPIPTAAVVAARTAPLYATGVALSLVAAAGLCTAYFPAVGLAAPSVAAAIVSAVAAPLAPVAVATVLALALTAVAVRFRHAGVVELVLGVLLVAGIVVGATLAGGVSGGDDAAALRAMGDVAGMLAAAVERAYPPAAWAAAAVTGENALTLAPFLAFSLGVPVLVNIACAACYPAVNALAAPGGSVRPRAERRLITRAAGPLRALVAKELRTIAAMPAYAMNDCAGLILMVVAAGALSIFGVDAVLGSGVIDGLELAPAQIAAVRVQVDAALPWVFGFCGAISLTAGPSVSLEAGSSWIMLTLPVGARTVLGSKLVANLVLGAVAVAVSAVLLAAGGTSLLLVIMRVIAAMGLLTGLAALALALDASRPNFAFTTPTEVVKRGLPVMVGSLGGVAISLGGGAAAVWLSATAGATAAAIFTVVVPLVVAGVGLAVLAVVASRGLPGRGWEA